MWSPFRVPDALKAVWRAERRAEHPRLSRRRRAQGEGPAVPAGRGLQGEDRAEASVHERLADVPLFEQLRHAVDRIAFADAAQVQANPSPRATGR